MKRIILSFLLTFLCCLGISAQVRDYTFSQSNGTFSSISAGVDPLIVSNLSQTQDTGGASVDLPFPFFFNNQVYDNAFVSNDGALFFNATSGVSGGISGTTGSGVLAAMNRDLVAIFCTSATATLGSNVLTNVGSFEGVTIGTTLRTGNGVVAGTTVTAFDEQAGTITMSNNASSNSINGIAWPLGKVYTKVVGEAPNRKFIIEWNNYSDYVSSTASGATSSSRFTFQIQLEETTNVIHYVYGDFANVASTTARTNQVGLRGTTNTDFNNRTATTSWANTVAGTVNTASVTRTNAIFPESGLTFTWSPPTCLRIANVDYERNDLSSIDFSWNVFGDSSSVEYELSSSAIPGEGVLASGSLPANSQNITIPYAYTQQGDYYFHVRNICSQNDSSVWVTTSINGGLVGVASATKSSILPISPNFAYNFSQQIYYADEIAEALINEDHHYITNVKFHFDKKTSANPATYGNWKVFMAHTDKTEFAGTPATNWVPVGDLIEVFNGDINFPEPTNNWFDIQLNTPFAWDGTSNVVLAVLEIVPSFSTGSEFMRYDTGTVNRGAIYRSGTDVPNLNNLQTISARYTYVPLIRLVGEALPPCLQVTGVEVNNVTKNSVTISWTGSLSDPTSYTYEVRTSGLPGTTSAVSTGDITDGANSVSVTGLTPGTDYFVYVKSNCTDGLIVWTEIPVSFTTLCNYPDLSNIVNDAICGIGVANLSATVSNNGIIEWFTSATAGNRIFEGAAFESPELSATTTYYVGSATIANNQAVAIGNGTTTSITYSNPFYSAYSNTRTQHLITAEELRSFGLTQGNITSVGLDVTNAGTLPMLNFGLKIGTATDIEELTNFVANDAFVTVNTNANFMPVFGVNTIQFDQPYNWDGVSDIILEFCHYTPGSTTTMNRGVKADATTNNSTIKAHISVLADVANACNNETTNKTSYKVRPVFIFTGSGLCRSPREAVEVVVSEAPALTLSSTVLNDVCQGVNSNLVTITAGAADYDTYIWEPAVGVFGNAQDGFYFNVHEDTQFTLKAINSQTECRRDITVNVNVTSAGYVPLVEESKICLGETIELNIAPETPTNVVGATEEILAYSFDTVENLGWTLNRTTGTVAAIEALNTITSEGDGFIRLSHGSNETGSIAMNNSIDLSNTEGVMIEFKHMAILEGNTYDYGFVEYSLDGGATWTSFTVDQYVGEAVGLVNGNVKRFGRQSYTDWSSVNASFVPTLPSWKTEKFVLANDENTDLSNVKFRFSYKSDGSTIYYGWLIDDVKIKSVTQPTYIWNGQTEMYLDADATIPYNGESVKTIYVKPTVANSHVISVTATTDSCVSIDETIVYVPNVVVPDFSAEVYCQAIQVSAMTFDKTNGHTYKWFASLNGTREIESIAVSGTYYVAIEFDGCSIPRVPVYVRIVGDVSVQVESVQKFCQAVTVADLVAIPSANDAVIYWYSSIDSTLPLPLDTPLVNDGKYYVSQDIFGCVTTRKEVTVKIFETPTAVTINEINVCDNIIVRNISINGLNQLNWYRGLNDISPIAGTLVLESGVYYVASKNDICESERVRIVVNVIENLPLPQINIIDVCGVGTVADLDTYLPTLQDGFSYKWFRTSTASEAINPATGLTTGTYYLEIQLSGCSSVRKPIAVRVNSKVAPVINAQIVCQNTTIEDLHFTLPTGVSYVWYETPTSTIALPTSHVLQNKAYYVRRFQFGCESEFTRVFVTVQATPSSPTGAPVQEFVQGSTIQNIAMNQPNVVWYISEEDALLGNNPLMRNLPLIDGQIYYGVLTSISNCRSLPTPVKVVLFLNTIDLDMASLKVYPNPTNGQLNIEYSESIDKIEVYTLTGQLIISEETNSSNLYFDFTNLSAGTYLIKIKVGDSNQIVKFVKK